MQQHVTLGIETSCDETSAAVLVNGQQILSNIISSQIPAHQRFGGVVPEIASRKHMENIIPVVQKALDEAGVSFGDLNTIAVTYGPGLVGALLVGVSAAKAMAYALDIPLVGVNHLEGHIYAGFLENCISLPVVCLVVSGGHTNLIYLRDHGQMEILGSTRDDAAGEAFDKVARKLGLEYPGGPALEKLAAQGEPDAVHFPRAWLEEGSLDFSFSGLKSAVINYLHKAEQRGQEVARANIAAGFQESVVDVLVAKTLWAASLKNVSTILVAGGVAANSRLRQRLVDECDTVGLKVVFPSPVLCTDNAAMIACRGYYQFLQGDVAGLDLNAVPGLSLQ